MSGGTPPAARRVVITGIGLVTPLAASREATWERLVAGKSGANKIEHFKVDDLPARIACVVPRVDGRGGGAGDAHAFDPDKTMSAKERRRIEDFILFAIAAADEAVADSGWQPQSDEEKNRTGVLIGSGIGGIEAIGANQLILEKDGPRKISPPARFQFATASVARTIPSSPPARLARTRWATLRASFVTAMPR